MLDEADTQGLESLALPLLGTGYANIQRTIDHAKLGSLLKQTVALLAIQGFEDRLRDLASPLKRGVVVVYSREAQGEEEHERWEAVTRFFGARPEQRELHIRTLLSSIGELCA